MSKPHVHVWVLFDMPRPSDGPERKVRALFKWAGRVLGMHVVKCRIDDPPKEAGTAGTEAPPARKTRPKRRAR
jgi:hypothetical protein